MHQRTARMAPRKVYAIFVSLLLVGAAVALVLSPEADATVTTPFSKVFGVNTNGGIVLRGNTLLTCQTSVSGCTAAQQGSGTNTNNDNYEMRYVNIDPDGTNNFNSSSSTLTLTSGSSVLFAGLYWSGDVEYATNSQGGDAPIAPVSVADKNKVRFKVPGGSYQTVTAARVDTATVTGRDFYQGFADVTSLVSAAGNGDYYVANVQATQNDSRYAGWALVIAYQNPNDPVRNLTVFDGFGYINSGTGGTPNMDIVVSGFQTPPSGTVTSKIGTVAYEGDLGITGDSLKLDGTTLSDSKNPANNYYNSTVSDMGVLDTARNPNFPNLMAVDIDQVSTGTALGNGKTSATLSLATSQDTFYPGVVTMMTDLYAPDIDTVVTPTDLNGGSVKPGDIIEYTITVKNEGNDGASDLVLTNAIPAGTAYVPGSITVDGASRTDAAGDDSSEIQSGSGTFRLGSGATSSAGGSLPTGSTTVVKYRVKVGEDTTGGTAIKNVANISVKGTSSGLSVSSASTVSTTTVTAAATDLAVTGTVTPSLVQKDTTDDAVGYDLTVVNNGPDAQLNSALTFTLPSGVTPGSTTASTGSCTTAGQVVTCSLGTVASGATVTVHVNAVAGSSVADPATATAAVSGKYADANTANNNATVALAANRAPGSGSSTATTTHNTAVTKTVLTSHSDPDGDTLRVQSVGTPAHGTAVVNANNTITYTPAAGYKGTDVVPYVVSDGRGGTASGTLTVTVANAAPTAVADSAGTPGRTAVTVNVKGNDTDPNGDTVTVTGVTQPTGGSATGTVVNNGDGTVTFTPSTSFGGVATFTYTISDGDGGTATGTVSVTVDNQAPTAVDDARTTPYHTAITVPVRANDTDPNNDTLTVTGVGTPRDTGNTQRGTVTTDGATVTYTPPTGFSGVVTFSYTISDGKGGTSSATVTITIANAPPVANADSATTPYHQAVEINARSNDTDPNNDTLTITGTGAATHGVVTKLANGNLQYAPEAGFSGTDSFTYTVSDGNGGTSSATVTVTVQNAPPVANPDARTIEPDHAVVVPVLLNDTDENPADTLAVLTFDALSVKGGTVSRSGADLRYVPAAGFQGVDTFTYTVSDGHGGTSLATVTISVVNTAPVAGPDAAITPTNTAVPINVLGNDSDAGGDALSVTAVTPGGHGTVTTDGSTVTYTPDDGWFGIDSFTYTVGDGRGGYDTGTVTVTVQNAAPTAGPDASRAQPGRANRIDVLANDTDANRDELSVLSVTQGARGTVAISADGKAVTYTPAAGQHGTDTFTYTVSDGNGNTAVGTVTVTVNAAPVAADDTKRTGTDQAVVIDVLTNDTDAEGDALTVTAGPASAHGTIAVRPDGTVQYTPATGWFGTDTFTYTVQDPAGGSSTGTVTVTVENAVPVAVDDTGYSTRAGGSVTVPVLINDTDANLVAGQTLTVTGVGRPAHGTAVVNADGTVTYTAGQHKGTDELTYTISDGHGGTATAKITIVVDNDAPVAAVDAATTGSGKAVTIDVLKNDTDPNGPADKLRVSAVTQPAVGTVKINADSTVTYTPPAGFRGQASFSYTAVDTDGLPASAVVTVVVANGASVAVADSASTPYQKAVSIPVLTNDTDPNGDPLTISAVAQPSTGKVTVVDETTLTFTPNDGFSGTTTFTYTITDGFGGTSTATVTVTVEAAPVVPDKAVKSAPGAPATVSVPTTDEGGRSVELVSVTQPANGTVRIEDGKVVYTPNPGFSGRDTFHYVVRDENGNLAEGEVGVKVTAAPLAGDDSTRTRRETGTKVDVLKNATDADGDELTIKSLGRPSHGTVRLNPDGTVQYVPAKGYVGADSFTYTVADADGNTSTGTITISVTDTGASAGDVVVSDDDPAAVTLPLTGADTVALALWGVGALLAGAFLMWTGRRRRLAGKHRR